MTPPILHRFTTIHNATDRQSDRNRPLMIYVRVGLPLIAEVKTPDSQSGKPDSLPRGILRSTKPLLVATLLWGGEGKAATERRWVPLSNAGLTQKSGGCENPATPIRLLEVIWDYLYLSFLPLDEAVASRAVLVVVPGSDGHAFGAS